ncbi:hypothetical protein MCOR25_000296 [Pyricularia grisea]|uniref:Ecp2 effector protein domain-containing protein n=1 Tax=Pyricularia grisea TaxID=148305 RepID=A0A6P8APR4_PYRGI|nr:hypothetical protein PgNI_11466 [Pyricularia grisea]KAI6383108.1 hypothetical protein MCOR25_000296 [Pyricularia grisea]TLD04020.1 hypothetical protein PgNI_11466 [Pyricularia grisea]
MRSLISICLLATLAVQAAGQAIGNWTIYRFSRNCTDAVEPPKDQNRCSYHFFISEKPAGAPGASFQQCTIHVYSDWLPATQIPWVAVACLENTEVSKYAVSSGWNSNGFITVNVMNLFTLENAYFGYDDKDLVGGAEVASKTERAYKFGTFEPLHPGGGELSRLEQRRSEALVQRRDDCDEAWWVVKKLQRRIDMSNHVKMWFVLQRCGMKDARCDLLTEGANFTRGIDARLDDFHDKPCDNNKDLHISWGYKADTDGGVMTIEDRKMRLRAFLGWDHVNDQITIEKEARGKVEAY